MSPWFVGTTLRATTDTPGRAPGTVDLRSGRSLCRSVSRLPVGPDVVRGSVGGMTTFVLAGGCFWCLDAVYRTLQGVQDVVSGYVGGTTDDPTYEAVCTGTTGHAEAVAVTFDESVLPADVVLDVFFTLHDPRQLNRQGADVGTQYRSAMFPADDGQRALFERASNAPRTSGTAAS